MPRIKTLRIERICEECSAKFVVKIGDFGRKYCCKACYRKRYNRLVQREAELHKQKVGS